MNCRQGDLAMIVWSMASNEGVFVTCVNKLGWFKDADTLDVRFWWEIDRSLPDKFGIMDTICCDDQLRPIRPHGDDETDESTAWLPPVPTMQPA